MISNYLKDYKENNNETVYSEKWKNYCRLNRLSSLKELHASCFDQKIETLIDMNQHHYSSKHIYKIFCRLYEKYFGEVYPAFWYLDKTRKTFFKVRKFFDQNDIEPESHIAHNMQYLRNFCLYKGMRFRPNMLCTQKALARVHAGKMASVSMYGKANYFNDVIFDNLYSSEHLLADLYLDDVDDDHEMHRVALRNVSELTEYYLASNTRLFEYVLEHDVLDYDKLATLDSISKKLESNGFRNHLELNHRRARICSAYDLCEERCPGSGSQVLIKKNMNIMNPRFWAIVRTSLHYTTVTNTVVNIVNTVPSSLGKTVYG